MKFDCFILKKKIDNLKIKKNVRTQTILLIYKNKE